MIENTNDFFTNFNELLVDAEQERLTFTPDKMMTTGIPIIDKHTLGIFPHDLFVIGADSGVGKSEIAYNISVENAKKDKKVMLFALEGNINEIAWRYTQREIAKHGITLRPSEYRVNSVEEVHEYAKEVYTNTHKEGRGDNLAIFNKSTTPTIAFIADFIRKSQDYFDMFVIDHLHYIQYSDDKAENQEISLAMRTLQQITSEIKKPIILVGHLRKRNMKEDPTKYDLHGSSNIPKEATTVLLMSPMDKYELASFNKQIGNDKVNRYSGTKFIVDKSRAGMPTPTKIGGVYDLWNKDYTDMREILGDDFTPTF